MKRIGILLLIVIFTGCTSEKKLDEVIQKGSVHISLPNEAYADALETLWNTTYPQYQGILEFDVKPANELVAFQADIEWVSDTQAMNKAYLAHEFDAGGYQIPEALSREALKDIFTPIQASGYLFAYDEQKLHKFAMDTSSLKTFENIAKKGKGAYFYRHTLEEMLPLWTHGIQDDLHTMDRPMNEKEMIQAISSFQALYQEMGFVDDPWITPDKIFDTYAFALVDPQSMKQSDKYQNGTLHFTSMPTYQKQSCAPYAQTYGFIASSDCPYTDIIQSFMDMVRSQQGLQAFLDTEQDIAVIEKADIADFHIYDARRKEMILAMNDSALWNLTVIKEKPGISIKVLFEQEDMTSILQNGICAKKSAEAIQQEMSNTLINWIKKQ